MKWEGVNLGALSVAAASRDLRAPLVRLRQLSFELEDRSINSRDTTAWSQLQLTLNEALRLVDQLSLAAQPLDDQLVLEPVSLSSLVDDVNHAVQPLSHALEREFVCELPARKRPVAVGNYAMLQSILVGFMSDALRYNNQPRPVELAVRIQRTDQVAVTIRDYGAEFDGRQSIRLPQAGQLVNNLNPVSSRPLMSSLNLLLADKLTRAMHGYVAVHRHRRGGVTIETCLPLSRQMSLLEVL